MSGLIFVTQLLDPDDPVLGFTPRLVRALAERMDRVSVVANEVRSPAPDLNHGTELFSLGKERGLGPIARGLRYQQILRRLCRGRPDALLAHMCPVYLNVGAPIAKRHRLPMLLWFAHPARSSSLRVADALADGVITSLPGAYPLPGPKVHVIGQATDMDGLAPSPLPPRQGPFRLICVGRTSPSKGFDVVIRAVAHVLRGGTEIRLRIVGPSTTDEERRYRSSLEELIAASGLRSVVELEDGVPPSRVPGLIREAHALVNAMVGGSGDKVVFEALSLGRPVLASNPALSALLGGISLRLAFDERNAQRLAARITDLASASPADLDRALATLRERVEREHSVDHWADRVVGLVRQLRGVDP